MHLLGLSVHFHVQLASGIKRVREFQFCIHHNNITIIITADYDNTSYLCGSETDTVPQFAQNKLYRKYIFPRASNSEKR